MSNSSLFTLALLRTHSFVFFTVQKTNRISVHSSQRRQDVFLRLLSVHFYSRTLLQVLSFVVSSLKSVCSGFCIFSAVMPRLPYLQVANKTNNASKYIWQHSDSYLLMFNYTTAFLGLHCHQHHRTFGLQSAVQMLLLQLASILVLSSFTLSQWCCWCVPSVQLSEKKPCKTTDH